MFKKLKEDYTNLVEIYKNYKSRLRIKSKYKSYISFILIVIDELYTEELSLVRVSTNQLKEGDSEHLSTQKDIENLNSQINKLDQLILTYKEKMKVDISDPLCLENPYEDKTINGWGDLVKKYNQLYIGIEYGIYVNNLDQYHRDNLEMLITKNKLTEIVIKESLS